MNNYLLFVGCLLLSFGYVRNFHFVAEINWAGVNLWGRYAVRGWGGIF